MSHDGVGNSRRAGEPSDERAPAGQRCDFCGDRVATVRRVAIDHDYDRLQTPHRELYACTPCSERKEQKRRGI